MRDWTGNNKSAYTIIGASNHTDKDREENDYYATDPTAIDDLFAVEEFSKQIWECACGENHLTHKMQEYEKEVYASDIIQRCGDCFLADFLKATDAYNGDIITNPPYKYAQEFCEKAIELTGNKVAMFLKLTFLEGQKRKKFFAKYPPKVMYVFSKRKICAQNGKFSEYPSSAIAYAWYVWEKGFTGETIIKWI